MISTKTDEAYQAGTSTVRQQAITSMAGRRAADAPSTLIQRTSGKR